MDLEMQIPSKVPKQDKKERKRREPHVPLATYYDLDKYQFEIGIDEAGRGPMLGRLYVAGVVLPKDGSMDTSELRDSKKISKKKLPVLYEHIIKNAYAYHITYIESSEIDRINIRQAVVKGMHTCAKEIINQLEKKNIASNTKEKYFLMVDGNDFPPYIHNDERISYDTFLQGDNAYANIAAASILAKVTRDNYIFDLCKRVHVLVNDYGLDKHMGYGTKKHLDAIRTYGITQYHRTTFGLCKVAKMRFV